MDCACGLNGLLGPVKRLMLSLAETVVEFAVFDVPLVNGCDVVVAGVPFAKGVAEGMM